VAEELTAAGATAQLADPAETAALRGPKKRAKTDRADARVLRTLRWEQRLAESWIPPAHLLEVRTQCRLYCALMEDRRGGAAAHPCSVVSSGRPCPSIALMPAASSPLALSAPIPVGGRPEKNERPHPLSPGNCPPGTPSIIMSPDHRLRTQLSLGAGTRSIPPAVTTGDATVR
jgi:hypothetical protein